jgi:ATP synthase protein I
LSSGRPGRFAIVVDRPQTPCYEPVLAELLSFSPETATTEKGKEGKTERPDKVARGWSLLKFSSLGIEMAVATFIGWGIGYWLDLQLGTEPWLMLVFLLLGVAAGFKGVFRAAREAQEAMGDKPASGETGEGAAESKASKGGEDKT